jgi:hypothetical protein
MLRTGTTVLPVQSHDLRSATVTSNCDRTVTILPTETTKIERSASREYEIYEVESGKFTIMII